MYGNVEAGRRGRFARALALGCLLAVCAPAAAERADRNKPVHLEADRVNIDDAKKVSVFEGNVVLTQGTLVIRGNRMVIREDKDGYYHGTTYGNPATFRQKREGMDEYIDGYAQRIVYDGKAERLEMFENAKLTRGGDEVLGSYISFDQPTEFFRVVGGGKKAATPGNPTGRVRAVIQPRAKDEPANKGDKPSQPLQSSPAPRGDRK